MRLRSAGRFRNWYIEFGRLGFCIKPSSHLKDDCGTFEANMANISIAWNMSLRDCVAAIERELLEIRATIPATGKETL